MSGAEQSAEDRDEWQDIDPPNPPPVERRRVTVNVRAGGSPEVTDGTTTGDDAMPATKKGTWEDPAIVGDPRIDHENVVVRAVAERLHGNESMHLHEYVSSIICPYCALRTSRVMRWEAQVNANEVMEHDTPFGLVRRG